MRRNLLVALALSLALAACGGAQKMSTSPQVPAAEASVDKSNGDNGNLKLVVKVKHLAPPDKVVQGASVYVVWAQVRIPAIVISCSTPS